MKCLANKLLAGALLILLISCGSQSSITPLTTTTAATLNANPQATPTPTLNNDVGCQINFSVDSHFENYPPALFPINQEFVFQANESSLTFINSNCPISLPSVSGFNFWAGRLMVGIPDTFGLLMFDTLLLGTPTTLNPTNLDFSVESTEIHLAHDGCHLVLEINDGHMIDNAHETDHEVYGVRGTLTLTYFHFHEEEQSYGDVAECFE